jgi:hypothetical protein
MWRCPKCKSEIRIFEACTTIVVFEDGTETEEEGFEWDDDNRAECVSCEWKGTAGEAFDESFDD